MTHDQSFIDEVAAEIWVLSDGKVRVVKGGLAEYRKTVVKELSVAKN